MGTPGGISGGAGWAVGPRDTSRWEGVVGRPRLLPELPRSCVHTWKPWVWAPGSNGPLFQKVSTYNPYNLQGFKGRHIGFIVTCYFKIGDCFLLPVKVKTMCSEAPRCPVPRPFPLCLRGKRGHCNFKRLCSRCARQLSSDRLSGAGRPCPAGPVWSVADVPACWIGTSFFKHVILVQSLPFCF